MKKMEKEKAKIDELKKQIEELTSGWQRTQADFVNFRKQAAEEKSRLCRAANESLLYDLLPVLDNFSLAAKHIPEKLADDAWAQGIKQIEKQLESVLENEGLEKIETMGQQFDPNLHEAVEHVASDKPEDEIVEEVLSGYKHDGEVLRPAKVKVSKG